MAPCALRRAPISWLALALLVLGTTAVTAAELDPQTAATLARNTHLILLAGREIDTRSAPGLSAGTRAADRAVPGAHAYYLVQFQDPIGHAARSVIESQGGSVLDYVPNQALLVRLPADAAEAVASDPMVQWLGAFTPALKLSPEIGRRTFTDPQRAADSHLWLTVELFPGEDPAVPRAAIEGMGGEVAATFDDALTHRLHVRLAPARLQEMAAVAGVRWIEEFPEITLRNNSTRWVIQSNIPDVTPLWDRGLHGEGQIVGHIDQRINRDSCYFRDPVDNTPGPNHRKLVSYRSNSGFGAGSHGCHTGCTIAGDQEPINGTINNNGIAYRARIAHANLSDITGFGGGASNLGQYLTLASGDGARVHTNSWGDDGTTAYTTWCRDIDVFSRDFEDDLVAFAVSNLSTLKTPENAKNCLAVGATQQQPNQANHGSGGTGPTADGRRKPEVYSPGVGIVSSSTALCATTTSTGTSMACPSSTGMGALVRQYYEDGFYPTGFPTPGDAFTPTGALTKATLINTTVDMTGVAGYPSNREGWGRLLADNALYFDGDATELWAVDVRHSDPASLESGEVAVHTVNVVGSSPLKITLVFTDEAAALGATLTPVNDLDLEVMPAGISEEPGWKGNVFANGSSAAGGTFDPLNNVEMVLLPAPFPGTYSIFVHARQVVSPEGQGYAIVVSGDLATPSAGVGPVAGSGGVPTRLTLSQNHPNPFNPSTAIGFGLLDRGRVALRVYDAQGHLVRTLVEGELIPNHYVVEWDGRNAADRPVGSGVYLYRLETPSTVLQRKMVLMK
jgi:hypothetical protein